MRSPSIREAIRLLLVALGVLCSAVGVIFALTLLCARTEPGVVKVASTLSHGEPTNCLYVLWGGRVALTPEPGDWASTPREGDRVAVLLYGKAGTLKSAHALWRVWKPAAGFGSAGLVLLISGLCIVRHRPAPQEIHVAPAI